MESLLSHSEVVNKLVNEGGLRLIGAFFDVETGAVQMMGQHPAQDRLLKLTVSGDVVRTAGDHPVPAEEAFTMLYSGNRRFAAGKAGLSQIGAQDKMLLAQLSDQGQNPVSVIIGCADSRAPIEMLFDMRPGDLFVLRNAGNTCPSSTGSLVGSAEYAVTHLRTKLIVVTGHTKCGAVTAAVDAVRKGACLSQAPGSIGLLLADIHDAAKKAVADIPNASMVEQVSLATKYNIFNTIEKLIRGSDIMYTGVKIEELQIHGAVYDIFSGAVEWLGEHPQLAELANRQMPIHEWRSKDYQPGTMYKNTNFGQGEAAKAAIQAMMEGNQRFIKGQWTVHPPRGLDVKPTAIVLGPSHCSVPLEDLFDVAPGNLIVQRVLGSVAGNQERTAYASIEYALARWCPPVLCVLMYSNSPTVEAAIQQLQGQRTPRAPIRVVLDHVIVSTLRAMQQAHKIAEKKKLTAAGEELLVRNLALELNCLYSMEMLLKSRIVRERVTSGKIELHAAVMDSNTGKVRFLGGHPRQEEVMLAGQLRDTAYASGMTATLPREQWATSFQLLDDVVGQKRKSS